MLIRKKIVFTNPEKWEDKNDYFTIEKYKKLKKLPRVLALCFCTETETIHQWKAFAAGISGCCIEFDRTKLLSSFCGIPGVRHGDVAYKSASELEGDDSLLEMLPFTKRSPFHIEREFRVIWEGNLVPKNVEIDLNLSSINKITLNEALPDPTFETIKAHLMKIIDPATIEINHSTLLNNNRWKTTIDNLYK
jgi:hypothetical protein